MFAVIRTDPNGVTTRLRTCQSWEAALIATEKEKDKLPLSERKNISAVCLDDGGYTEILF